MSLNRVVITGLGVVSPLGVGVQCNWRRLLENQSGISSLSEPEYAAIPCRVAGRVPMRSENQNTDGSLDFASYFSRMSDLKSMSLASAFALVAAQEAIEQSQVKIFLFFGNVKLVCSYFQPIRIEHELVYPLEMVCPD